MLSGFVGDEKSVRLTGQVGIGLSDKDIQLLMDIAIVLKEAFPELDTVHESGSLYHWVCNNLEYVPARKRVDAESMIRRVGLDSGDIEQIARRANRMFADFIGFFNEWYDNNHRKPETA
jgi:hypothetical protein